MKTIFKKIIASATAVTMALTLFAGISLSTSVKADTENLVANGTWSFYAANYSWRSVLPEPYDQATLKSLKLDSEDLTANCSFTTYKKYDENGQPLKGTLWNDDIIFSDPMEVTAKLPSYGFEADINSWGWAGEYDGDKLVGDAPYTLTGIVSVPVEKGKIYTISMDLNADTKSGADTINKMFTINVANSEGTILNTETVTVPYGTTKNYSLEMASSDSESLVVTVCYGCHVYSGEPTNGTGVVKVSNASVTYLKDDESYDPGPELPTATPTEKPTEEVTEKPTVKPSNNQTTKSATKTLSKVKGLKAVNKKKGTVKLSWKKVSKAKKYQIKVGRKTYTAKKNTLTVKKLKKGKKYTFKVRAIASGYKSGAWVKKSIKVKK